MEKRKITYLCLRVNGRLVKVDPDIYFKIRNPQNEEPFTKYNGNIRSMQIDGGYPVIVVGKKPPQKHIPLSRFVMNAKKGEIVDHINRDRLDNRRCNLRIVTKRQNNLNKKCKNPAGYIGVNIKNNGKSCQGRFRSACGKELTFQIPDSPHNRIVAAFARDKFVLAAGEEEYARLNFNCFKFEPFRSLLLAEDLRKWKEPRLAPPRSTELAESPAGGVAPPAILQANENCKSDAEMTKESRVVVGQLRCRIGNRYFSAVFCPLL